MQPCNWLAFFYIPWPAGSSVEGRGRPGSLHSLFLFPMHIPLWDVTLKRHRAWENGAAEVFHQADRRHFIILSAWQLASKQTHTHTHSAGSSHGPTEEDCSVYILTTGDFCVCDPCLFHIITQVSSCSLVMTLCECGLRWYCSAAYLKPLFASVSCVCCCFWINSSWY